MGMLRKFLVRLIKECHDTMAAALEVLEAGHEKGQSLWVTQGSKL